MKIEQSKTYSYKTKDHFNRLIFSFIVLLQFLFLPPPHAHAEKQCRSHFVNADILESFTPEERRNFQTLVEKYGYALQQPHESVVDLKIQLNQELKRFIEIKSNRQFLSKDIASLFFSSVREFSTFQHEKNQTRIHREIDRDLDFQSQVSEQHLRHQKYIKYRKLLEKFKAQNFEDLLEKIFERYKTQDIHEVLLTSAGKLQSFASYKADILEIEYLLSLQENVNLVDEWGNNALIYATLMRRKNIVEFLIHAGADVNIINNYGVSPLFIAVSNEHADVVRTLLESGANKDLQDFNGETPLILVLNTRSMKGNSIAKILVEAGAQLNLESKKGRTALINAVVTGNLEIVNLLLKAGAQVNAFNKDGHTPLMRAAGKDSTDIILSLLAAGAGVNLKNSEGFTALMSAAQSTLPKNITTLLQAQANATPKNNKGETALTFATRALIPGRRLNEQWGKDKKESIEILKSHTPVEPSVFKKLWNLILRRGRSL